MEPKNLNVAIYDTTDTFRAISQHAAVCFDDMTLVAVTGPADDKESQEYATLFAASHKMLAALEGAEACLKNVFELFQYQDDGDWLDEVLDRLNESTAAIASARGVQ